MQITPTAIPTTDPMQQVVTAPFSFSWFQTDGDSAARAMRQLNSIAQGQHVQLTGVVQGPANKPGWGNTLEGTISGNVTGTNMGVYLLSKAVSHIQLGNGAYPG